MSRKKGTKKATYRVASFVALKANRNYGSGQTPYSTDLTVISRCITRQGFFFEKLQESFIRTLITALIKRKWIESKVDISQLGQGSF